MAVIMRLSFLAVLIFSGAYGSVYAEEPVMGSPEHAFSAHSEDPHRRFDFWVGSWDVNMRIRQDDGTWPFKVQSRANIYSILKGRAVLELWESVPIKGYSLRYYDPALGKWVLWLNWPGPDRASTGRLEGEFTFGRGDFFSEDEDTEGNVSISRYSFNDITPFSLRWDDHYSKDGGKTWSDNWRMEFSRRAVEPVQLATSGKVPTWVDGSRCKRDESHQFDRLIGNWVGEGRAEGEMAPASMSAYPILDGCAVMGFMTIGKRQWFLFTSYDSGEGTWENNILSDDPTAPMQRFFSSDDPLALSSKDGEGEIAWRIGEDGITWDWTGGTDGPVRARLKPVD